MFDYRKINIEEYKEIYRKSHYVLLVKEIEDHFSEVICFEYAAEDAIRMILEAKYDDELPTLIFHGTVTFDGPRHIYFGEVLEDPDGYLYYPDMPKLISCLKAMDDYCLERFESYRLDREKDIEKGYV